jgi:hypothetical protein
MRHSRLILVTVLIWGVMTGATAAVAGERADWGKVVCAGTASDGGVILIENERGTHALVVDPYGEVRTGTRGRATLATIKPGDHIDFAVSTWAGMQIVDLVVVTPQVKLATAQ